MIKRFFGIFVVGLLCAAPLTAQAKVNIFACEPEWAELAREIGGDKIKAFAATHAKQDPHYIRARPSLIAKARFADLLLCSGADLEVGWLPLLLLKASSNVQPGAIGHLMAADVVPLLEKPKVLDRSMGDIHPQGNPHVHLNPYNVLLVAEALADRLAKIDLANASVYRRRHANFSSRWRKAIKRWEAKAISLQNKEVAVHHKSFIYLLDWLGLKQTASLEAKPGIPPSAAHLEALLQKMKTRPVGMILRTPYEPDDASLWLAQKTGIPAIMLPYTIGGDAYSDNLFALFERSIFLMRQVYGDQR